MNFGNITDYEYEIHNGEIVLSADMQLQSDGTNNKKKRKTNGLSDKKSV